MKVFVAWEEYQIPETPANLEVMNERILGICETKERAQELINKEKSLKLDEVKQDNSELYKDYLDQYTYCITEHDILN